ncbi:MAG: HD domain-containing protein, partial [Bacteroidota bacterium]
MSAKTSLQRDFQNSLQTSIQHHRRGAGGIRIALALAERLDVLVRTLYRHNDDPGKHHLALVALGGYGRKELCFSSDTDIMFLLSSDADISAGGQTAKALLHTFLDIGLNVGHSFRTIPDCLELAGSDHESWISLLESRFLCGNRSAYNEFKTGLKSTIRTGNARKFTGELLARIEQRHQKYGNSTKLLEPNVKNSSGGLRDLHAVLWLLAGTRMYPAPVPIPAGETALSSLLASSPMKKKFHPQLLNAARKALDHLLRTRNEMHVQAAGLHDTLEFTFQRKVAEGLGYRAKGHRSSVEQFMQHYYVAARVIATLQRRARGVVERTFVVSSPGGSTTTLDAQFALREHRLYARGSRIRYTNSIVLRAFLHEAENVARLSDELEDGIVRNLGRLTPLRSREETALFRRFLNLPKGMADSLQKMNDLGILARWIPEWKPMVAFFQHNQYHYYTADEHTLMVCVSLESLADSPSAFGKVYRSLPRRDTLVLAALLHDIAKPHRVGDHEVAGVAIAEKVLKRLRYDDVVKDVVF